MSFHPTVPGMVNGPTLTTPSDSSSVIHWSPPQLTNGRLTGYVLSIVQLLDYDMPSGSAVNATVDIIMTSYTWSGLSNVIICLLVILTLSALDPGVPYQTCISAINPLGPGDQWCKVFFTVENGRT